MPLCMSQDPGAQNGEPSPVLTPWRSWLIAAPFGGSGAPHRPSATNALRSGLSHPAAGIGWRISSGFVICRVWRGWTTKDNAGAYERVVRGEVIPGIEARRIPGFRSIDLVRREREHVVEFMTLMWFDGLDNVKGFMGEDYEAAHVPARAQAVLADFDRRSAHYEVLDRREQPQ